MPSAARASWAFIASSTSEPVAMMIALAAAASFST